MNEVIKFPNNAVTKENKHNYTDTFIRQTTDSAYRRLFTIKNVHHK